MLVVFCCLWLLFFDPRHGKVERQLTLRHHQVQQRKDVTHVLPNTHSHLDPFRPRSIDQFDGLIMDAFVLGRNHTEWGHTLTALMNGRLFLSCHAIVGFVVSGSIPVQNGNEFFQIRQAVSLHALVNDSGIRKGGGRVSDMKRDDDKQLSPAKLRITYLIDN